MDRWFPIWVWGRYMDIGKYFDKDMLVYPSGFHDLVTPCNWITDAKVSACFCKMGICALDYHGIQPVSRNSKMVTSPYAMPAMRFRTGSQYFEISGYRSSAWACIADISNGNGISCVMSAMAEGCSVLIQTEFLTDAEDFTVCFDMNRLYTNVHGKIQWEQTDTSNNKVIMKGNNRYLLSDWVKNKGAYLIPVKDHKRIFGCADGTDVNNLDVLPDALPSVYESTELFIDSTCVMGFSSLPKFDLDKDDNNIYLGFGPVKKASMLHFTISFADDAKGVEMESQRILSSMEGLAKKSHKRYEKLYDKQPSIFIEGYPEISAMLKWIPRYIEAAKQPDTGMTRGSASSYYWVWGWDNIVTAAEMGKWGDYKGQEKIIRFILSHRFKDGSVPHRYDRNYDILQTMQFGSTDALFISLCYQYYCDTDDIGLLKDCYPALKQIWKGLCAKCDDRGFISGLGFYPDAPRDLGRERSGFTAMETGTFFFAARIMENIADIFNDQPVKDQAEHISAQIQKNYLPFFMDEDNIAIYDSIHKDGVKNRTYPLYAYMGAYNRFGLPLFDDRISVLADFFVNNYLTSKGIRTMPEWDACSHTESVHHSWYPHWDIYAMKIMRMGLDMKNGTAAIRTYLDDLTMMWKGYYAAMELVDLDQNAHGQAWNCNCASGIYRTIIESVAGICTDMGSITILPPIGIRADISGLWACKGRWDIKHIGKGDFSHLKIDGTDVYGSYTVPAEFLTSGSHTLEILYEQNRKQTAYMI